jgi:hypothetical protein
MLATLWEIANALDEQRVPAKVDSSVELTIPTQRLRSPDGRSDNVNLRQWLEKLNGLKLQGEHRGNPWGAVVVGEWHIEQGGTVARIHVMPAAVLALRSADTFAKIETAAAHQLPGHARRLYAILADKKRLGKPEWTFDVDQLRALMGVAENSGYQRWNNFRARVIAPAVEAINDYGTVTVEAVPVKRGRAVHAVRFSWKWKTLDEAQVTDEENERHSVARRKDPSANPDAPPLVDRQANDLAVSAAAIQELTAAIRNKLRVTPSQ